MKRISAVLTASFLSLAAFIFAAPAQAAVIDPSFGTDGGFTYDGYPATIYLIKVLDDGKVFVGGSFNEYNGSSVQGGLVRLNADLTIDTSFDLGGEGFDNGSVMGINILDDGKMLVNGGFELFNGEDAEGILRLNADGTLDETFDPLTGGSNTGGVWDVIVLDDGDYLAAFPSNGGTYRGEGVRGIFRLNPDGSIDNSFSLDEKFEHLYVTVQRMVRQPDGKILATGGFYYRGADGEEGGGDDESYGFMRLNADGSTDEGFYVENGFGGFNDIALLSDGRMYVGGQFSSYGTASSSYVARLNADGTVDDTFSLAGSFEGSPVYSLLVQDDGRLLVGGGFYSYNEKEYLSLIRFNEDGSLDEGLPTNIAGGTYNTSIRAMSLLPDGRLFAGGEGFNTYGIGDAEYDTGGAIVYFIDPRIVLGPQEFWIREGDEVEDGDYDGKHLLTVALNTKPTAPVTITLSSLNGEIEFSTSTFTFYPSDWDESSPWEGSHPSYYTTVRAVDDSVVEGNETDAIQVSVSSSDDDYDGVDVGNLQVFVADNDSALLLDQTFRPTGIDGSVRTSVVLPDDTSVVGGSFSGGIRKLNIDGSEDPSFDIGDGFNATVNDIKRLSNGKFIVTGEFTQFDGENVGRIARLNSDGSFDASFDVGDGFSDEVLGAGVTPDGKIVIWGYFSSFDGENAPSIARLNSDGSFDASFDVGDGFNGDVTRVQVQADGKVVVAGDFSEYDGQSIAYGLARLNTDGTLDTAFSANLGDGFDSTVRFVALQSDGKLIVSGYFEALDGNPAFYLVRLNSDGTLDGTFAVAQSYDEALNGPVYALAFLGDGRMLVGGDFSIYGNGEGDDIPSAVFLINADGTPDFDFQPVDKYNEVTTISLQADGKVLVGDTSSSNSLRRFGDDGVQDEGFSIWSGFGSGYPNALQVKALSNGKYLALGGFNGSFTQTLLMINEDGSVDESWVPEASVNEGVGGFYVDSDEKIVVWGDFGLARLNADGSLDETFDVSGLGEISVLSVFAYGDEGQLLVSKNTNGDSIIRINSDGSLDESFSADAEIFSGGVVAVESNGDILVSAEIIFNNGYNELARLNPDGSIKEIISDNFGFYRFGVGRVLIQPDGKMLITGFFRRTSNSTIYNFTRLNADLTFDREFGLRSTDSQINDLRVMDDGGIIFAGSFSYIGREGENLQYGQRIMKLLPNGDVDLSFPTGGDGGAFQDTVYSFDIDSDNKIVVAGQMQTFRGVRVQNIARLIDTALLQNQEDVDTESATISGLSVTSNNSTEVRVSLSTNEPTSGKIYYGPTSSYGMETDEFNVAPRVVSHSVNLSNLNACTTYHYQVVVEDSSNNLTTTSDGTFKTLGCESSGSAGGNGASSNRRSSVAVSAPVNQSISLGGGGGGSLTINQILSLLARFLNPSVVETLNSVSAGTTTVASVPASSGSSAPAPRPSSIRRNLTVGSVGDDVRQLQSFLINQNGGSTTRAQALANVGATGYFGSLTRAALAEYQAANGVVPSAGYFGPVTRGVLQVRGQ